MQRQPYEKPTITLLGTLADLTEAGGKHIGADFAGYKDHSHATIPGTSPGDS